MHGGWSFYKKPSPKSRRCIEQGGDIEQEVSTSSHKHWWTSRDLIKA